MFTEPVHRDAIQFAQFGEGHPGIPFSGLRHGSQDAFFRRLQHQFQVSHNRSIPQLFKGTKDWNFTDWRSGDPEEVAEEGSGNAGASTKHT
jgi:hypothetical protein